MYLIREDDAPLADDPALMLEACEAVAEREYDLISRSNPALIADMTKRQFITRRAQRHYQEFIK